jgi:hypothetical protein
MLVRVPISAGASSMTAAARWSSVYVEQSTKLRLGRLGVIEPRGGRVYGRHREAVALTFCKTELTGL